jgi:dephospho-CoA kinase
MIVIGLTGSIGMGKSAVAAMFRDENIPVFDADAVVHELQGPNGALVAAIEAAFPGCTTVDGVDRAKLGARVFGDLERLRNLEAIVHPAVASARLAFLQHHRDAAMVVFDIPLLLEKGRPPEIDVVIVVSAPAAVQRERVLARPGMTPEKFEQILTRQMPDAEKRALADHIIDTGTTFLATRAQVREVIACLLAAPGPS